MEIQLKNSEDMILPQIVPDVRRRQVVIDQMVCNCNLTASSLDWALAMLGGLEPQTTAYLVVADGYRDTAQKLAIEFRLAAIILPPQVMSNIYSWALVSAKGAVYSVPQS